MVTPKSDKSGKKDLSLSMMDKKYGVGSQHEVMDKLS
jgi:hypothetical protein